MNLYHINNILKLEDHPIFISLGNNCCIAYHIQKLGLKSSAFPFDWTQTPDIDMLSLLIQNNCKDLFSNLILDGTNFAPLIKNEWNENKCIIIKIKNFKYNINFNNELASFIYYQQITLNDIKKKYKKRIKNFYNIMTDSTKYKKLYRIGKLCEIPKLNNLNKIFISKGFTNYTIYFVPDNLNIITDSDYIPIIDISEIDDSWKKNEYNWLNIFNRPPHNL